jgi:hypothetical protein
MANVHQPCGRDISGIATVVLSRVVMHYEAGAVSVTGGSTIGVTVARMAVDDARAMITALAEPEALLVFGAIATATSKARLLSEMGHPMSGTPYITPFGLEKKTSLPRDVIEKAARRLKRAGLLEVLPDKERGYESWRINEAALVEAST